MIDITKWCKGASLILSGSDESIKISLRCEHFMRYRRQPVMKYDQAYGGD
jgi:hypothetical protein